MNITKREAERIVCALWRARDWTVQSAFASRGAERRRETAVARRYGALAKKLKARLDAGRTTL